MNRIGLSASTGAGDSGQASADTSQWPAPSFFEIVEPGQSSPRDCTVANRNGQVLVGKLLRFLPDSGVCEIAGAGERETSSIPFVDIKLLRLSRSVVLRPRDLGLGGGAHAVMPEHDRQDFTVNFVDGDRLSGKAFGLVRERAGLFVFIASGKDTALPVFVPAGAFTDFELGKPIGEILEQKRHVSRADVESALEEQKRRRARRVGQYLAENAVVTQQQLDRALDEQRARPNVRLGDALVELGVIKRVQLDEALERQWRARHTPLGEILSEMGLVDRETVHRLLASKLGIPFLKLETFPVDHEVLRMVPKAFCVAERLIPVQRREGSLVVATGDPFRFAPLEALGLRLQLRVVAVLAQDEEILRAIERHYARAEDLYGKPDSPWERSVEGNGSV